MRLPRLFSFLRREEGISLVMAVGVLAVLSLSGSTLVYYSSANARSAEFSKDNGGAYDLAESGIAHALAVLDNSPAPLTPSLLQSTTVSLDGGTATYSGVLSATTWTITSTGAVKNPTGASDVKRTVTRTATVFGLNVGASPEEWGKIYHANPAVCMTVEDVTIPSDVSAAGDICLKGTGKITGAGSTVEAGDDVIMTRGDAITSTRSSATGAGWTSSGSIGLSNNSYATAVIAANAQSANLDATNFGFSIPSTANITGVVANVERKASAASSIDDWDVFLLKGGVAAGSDKAQAGAWGTSDYTETYGGSTDLWGTTLTPANVNASNFGLRFKADSDVASTQTAYVDYISITVYYQVVPTTSIGTVSTPIEQADIQDMCTFDTQPAHNPCTSVDKVYANTITSDPPVFEKPTIDLAYWYSRAKPGPLNNCTVGSFPGGFDNDTTLNNSRPGSPEITPPSSSYTCEYWENGVKIGEISWNHTTDVLKVKGTIYVDGDFRFDDDASLVNYQGRAIIYATDDLEFDEVVCAGGNGTSDCRTNMANWDPSQNMLILLTGNNSEFDQGGTTPNITSAFQGVVYAEGTCTVHEDFFLSGPILCDVVSIPEDVVANEWPTFSGYPSLGSLIDGQMYADPYTATEHLIVAGEQSG